MSNNNQFGTVVWNTRTWVWYHPRYPHTIRFDLDAKTGVFKFRPSPSQSGKNEGLPYADWLWENGKLKSMGSAGGKVAPSCLEWKLDGDVPVPAILLAGMSELLVLNSRSV